MKLKVLFDVEGVGGLLGPEELAAGAAWPGAAAADEDEKHEACNHRWVQGLCKNEI